MATRFAIRQAYFLVKGMKHMNVNGYDEFNKLVPKSPFFDIKKKKLIFILTCNPGHMIVKKCREYFYCNLRDKHIQIMTT